MILQSICRSIYVEMNDTARAAAIVAALEALYPDAECTLDYREPYQLLIAAILAAQCTDARVNQVTASLFVQYPDLKAFATADRGELENAIRTCGLFRNKARAIQMASQALLERHGGQVPSTLAELTALPGVGRKIGNLMLGDCFGQQAVVVDTHCARISRLLGLTDQTDPVAIEKDLVRVIPETSWTAYGHLVVTFGRDICVARCRQCVRCPLRSLCRYGQGLDITGWDSHACC
jgi:endonuclease-3